MTLHGFAKQYLNFQLQVFLIIYIFIKVEYYCLETIVIICSLALFMSFK